MPSWEETSRECQRISTAEVERLRDQMIQIQADLSATKMLWQTAQHDAEEANHQVVALRAEVERLRRENQELRERAAWVLADEMEWPPNANQMILDGQKGRETDPFRATVFGLEPMDLDAQEGE